MKFDKIKNEDVLLCYGGANDPSKMEELFGIAKLDGEILGYYIFTLNDVISGYNSDFVLQNMNSITSLKSFASVIGDGSD